jgi:hypothetical protein
MTAANETPQSDASVASCCSTPYENSTITHTKIPPCAVPASVRCAILSYELRALLTASQVHTISAECVRLPTRRPPERYIWAMDSFLKHDCLQLPAGELL